MVFERNSFRWSVTRKAIIALFVVSSYCCFVCHSVCVWSEPVRHLECVNLFWCVLHVGCPPVDRPKFTHAMRIIKNWCEPNKKHTPTISKCCGAQSFFLYSLMLLCLHSPKYICSTWIFFSLLKFNKGWGRWSDVWMQRRQQRIEEKTTVLMWKPNIKRFKVKNI